MKRALLITGLVVVLMLAAIGIASAHATVDHCTPAVGSTVATAPSQLVCVMSEEIDTKQSTISVWNASGAQVDKKDAHVDLNDPDHKTLVVSLDSASVPNGIYTVKWHAVTPDDGGITDGTWQFIVGSASATVAPTTFVEAGATSAAPTTTGAAATATTAAPTSAAPEAATATAATAVATTAATTAAATPAATAAAPTTAPTTGASPAGPSTVIGFALLLGVILVGFGLFVRRRAS